MVDRQAPPVFSTCVGCFLCKSACPYQAIEEEEIKRRDGELIKTVAKVNPGLCQGCGTCVSPLPHQVDRPAGLHATSRSIAEVDVPC